MSAPENNDATPFVETDDAPTHMTYDDGKWHWFPAVVWVGVMIGLVIYAARLLVPSLSEWGAP